MTVVKASNEKEALCRSLQKRAGWIHPVAMTGLLLAADVTAASHAAQPPDADARPRIGLVLAGGGAKGGAHVGVLKVLEELHVPVDCIAGTSMGALVGAGYASGMPAADIEEFVNGIDWKTVVGGVGQRALEPVEQKRRGNPSLELGVRRGRLVAPAGLINTSGIENLLRSYVAQARMVADFNLLPIPYRAVATDLVTGSMVVLGKGDVAIAMRASMAFPGVFAPVIMGDYILADGGIVRNIPVDVARSLCADVVIVVNLVELPAPSEKLLTAGQVLGRSIDVMFEANENLQLSTLTDRDIRIDVPMGDIGTADFERTPQTILLGEHAARAMASRLAAYSVSEKQYVAWRAGINTNQAIDVRLADVRIEGLKHVNPAYLMSLTTVRPGDLVQTDSISRDATRLAALDDLESVEYRLEGDPAHPALVWQPKEKSSGPDVILPSIGFYTGGEGDLDFVLGVKYVRRWINRLGGQWRNNVQVGFDTALESSFYQPLDVSQRFFVEPKLAWRRSLEDLYNDGSRIADYRFLDAGGQIDLGLNLSRSSQVRAGYWLDERETKVTTGVELLPESDLRDAGLHATWIYDTRDSPAFATHGWAAKVEYLRSDDSLGAERDWQRIEGAVRTAIPIGRNMMWISAAGGSDLSDSLPGDRAFSLGGPQSFPGYAHDELRARSYWTVSSNFLWHFKDLVSIRNDTIYGSVSLQAGQVFDRVDPVADGSVYGLSALIGGRTPIGVFSLGVGVVEHSWGAWLAIGRPVARGSMLDDNLFR